MPDQKDIDIAFQKVKGLRSAYIEALEYVKGDAVIYFSPDGNSIPELITKLIERIQEGYDMVIVSRYREGARSHDDSCFTRLVNWTVTKVINLFFGGHYTDAMVIYRAIRVDIFKKLGLDKPNPFIAWAENKLKTIVGLEAQLSIRCAKNRIKTIEIPGDEPVRIGGMTKMKHLRCGIVLLLLILCEFFRRSIR